MRRETRQWKYIAGVKDHLVRVWNTVIMYITMSIMEYPSVGIVSDKDGIKLRVCYASGSGRINQDGETITIARYAIGSIRS